MPWRSSRQCQENRILSIPPSPFRLATEATFAPVSCFVQVTADDGFGCIQVGCKLQEYCAEISIVIFLTTLMKSMGRMGFSNPCDVHLRSRCIHESGTRR